ncbi:MAG: hypothetical protein C4297_13605 [Gemmataceae bacterium]
MRSRRLESTRCSAATVGVTALMIIARAAGLDWAVADEPTGLPLLQLPRPSNSGDATRRSDWFLSVQARLALWRDPVLSRYGLEVYVRQGVVTVYGAVGSELDRQRVRQVLSGLDARALRNETFVRTGPAVTIPRDRPFPPVDAGPRTSAAGADRHIGADPGDPAAGGSAQSAPSVRHGEHAMKRVGEQGPRVTLLAPALGPSDSIPSAQSHPISNEPAVGQAPHKDPASAAATRFPGERPDQSRQTVPLEALVQGLLASDPAYVHLRAQIQRNTVELSGQVPQPEDLARIIGQLFALPDVRQVKVQRVFVAGHDLR